MMNMSRSLNFEDLYLNGNHAPVSGYQQKLEAFKQSDAERDALVEEVIRRYEDLQKQHNQLIKDHENERHSRQHWQDRTNEVYEAYSHIKRAADMNPFVMVIMDGDGAIFQDALYEANGDRGADAAHTLHQEIKRHVAEKYPQDNTSSWNIVVNAFCNVQDLAYKLRSSGLLKQPQDLLQFARAFGLNQPLFNFVDVGSGKERADNKVRETFRLYLHNLQCRHLVFVGINHDAGYRTMLDPYKRDIAASRISLLETYPSHSTYNELGFATFQAPTVFRSKPLPERPDSVMAPLPPLRTTISQPMQMPSMPASPQTARQPLPPPQNPIGTGRQPSIPKSASPAPADSWATVGKSGTTATKSIDITPAKPKQQKFILLNADEERLDAPLPQADKAALARFFDRHNNKKVCNNYHLLGKCELKEQGYCDYDHGERLSPGEILVLRTHARKRCCPNKSLCREFDCFWGHTCPYNERCRNEICWFEDVHDVDRKAAWKVMPDWQYEKV